jgi:hypothetical protein
MHSGRRPSSPGRRRRSGRGGHSARSCARMRHLAPRSAFRYDGARAGREVAARAVPFVCDRSKNGAVYHSRNRASNHGGLRTSRQTVRSSSATPALSLVLAPTHELVELAN